jgi:cytochrome b pre-mRNA-processing protein 3
MLYDRIIAQSRNPIFYTRMGVPDDLIGRYNMIIIHLLILFASIRNVNGIDGDSIRQTVFEKFISEMEGMVRDFGVGGARLHDEVKNIVGISSKQIMIYEDAVLNGGRIALSAEVLKEFERSHEEAAVDCDALAEYVFKSISNMRAQTAGAILEGHVDFAA